MLLLHLRAGQHGREIQEGSKLYFHTADDRPGGRRIYCSLLLSEIKLELTLNLKIRSSLFQDYGAILALVRRINDTDSKFVFL